MKIMKTNSKRALTCSQLDLWLEATALPGANVIEKTGEGEHQRREERLRGNVRRAVIFGRRRGLRADVEPRLPGQIPNEIVVIGVAAAAAATTTTAPINIARRHALRSRRQYVLKRLQGR